MKKNIKLLFGMAVISAAAFAAGCAEKHEHSWNAAWTNDANAHWHACAGCDEKNGSAAHDWAETWQSDENGHWQVCETCESLSVVVGHSGGKATCEDAAVCDTCGVAYGEANGHSYEWKFDGEKHWKECSVEGCGVIEEDSEGSHTGGTATCKDKAVCEVCESAYGEKLLSHVWEEDADMIYCSVCDEELYEMYDVMQLLTKGQSLVKKGVTTYQSGYEGAWRASETHQYEYRNNYMYVHSEYDGSTIYYMLKENGEPYSVRVEDGSAKVNNYDYSADDARGYRFNPIVINSIMEFYGAEELISMLQEEAEYDANDDYVYEFKLQDGKIVGSFSFGFYAKADGYYFELSVEFALNEKNYLESASVTSYKYLSSEFEEDANGNAKPTVDTAFYQYQITLTQYDESATADEENPYDPAKVLVSSFDLMTELNGGELVPEVLTYDAASAANYFYLQNVTPATAIPALNPVLFYINGQEADFFDSRLMATYSKESGYVILRPQQQIGEFTWTVRMGDVTKSFTINVIPSVPTSLSPNVWDGTTYSAKTSVTTYEDKSLQFNAVANATHADARFTAEITSVNASTATLVWDDTIGDYIFTATVEGTYTIKLTSSRNPSVTTSLTVNVEKLPDMSKIFSGEYQYTQKLGVLNKVVYAVTFVPNADGVSGQVNVEWKGNGTVVYEFLYTAQNGLQLNRVGGATTLMQTLVLNEDFTLSVERDGTYYLLKKVGAPEVEEEKDANADHPLYSFMKTLSGTYKEGRNISGTYYGNIEVAFTPESATDTKLTGTLKIVDPNSGWEKVCAYEFTTSGGFALLLEEGESLVDGNTTYEIVFSGNTLSVIKRNTSTGSEYNFVCVQENADAVAYVVA